MSILLPHRKEYVSSVTSVYIVTTLASKCQQCYHIDKYIPVVLPHKRICQYCHHITFSKSMSKLLTVTTLARVFSTVTTLASACLHCYQTGKYMSVVCTVSTLASICKCYKYYLIGRYLSELLPYLQLSVYTVTTLALICQ